MAKLEAILGGITDSPGSTKANSTYTPQTLTETVGYIEEFSGINTETTEGLKQYEKLTELKTKEVSRAKVGLTQKQIREELEERFKDYTNSHIKPIVKEIDESKQTGIGYQFCPNEKSDSEKYEVARKAVHGAKETIETIDEDPEKYIKKIIGEAPTFMKNIVGRHPDEVVAIDKQDAQRKALKAIGLYGSANFVIDTYRHQKSLEDGLKEEAKAISKERSELEKKAKPGMDSIEEARYFAEVNKKEATLNEKASKMMDPEKLRQTIVGTAIAAIKEKTEDSEE